MSPGSRFARAYARALATAFAAAAFAAPAPAEPVTGEKLKALSGKL